MRVQQRSPGRDGPVLTYLQLVLVGIDAGNDWNPFVREG